MTTRVIRLGSSLLTAHSPTGHPQISAGLRHRPRRNSLTFNHQRNV